MATEALSLDAINVFYGDSHVLQNVGFAVHPGELLSLLGRNGVGKTTCIHAIAGFVPPRSGSINLFGMPIAGSAPEAIAHAGIGLVPQGRRIFPSLTVQENLAVAARPGTGWTRAEVRWTIERLYETLPRLRERRRQMAGTLSGGEQQMLAIARALATNPRVLLMDEPSEGLAPRIVAEVGEVLRLLKESGLSILLVEQNTRMALSLADNVIVLNAGEIAYRGTAADLASDEALMTQLLGIY